MFSGKTRVRFSVFKTSVSAVVAVRPDGPEGSCLRCNGKGARPIQVTVEAVYDDDTATLAPDRVAQSALMRLGVKLRHNKRYCLPCLAHIVKNEGRREGLFPTFRFATVEEEPAPPVLP